MEHLESIAQDAASLHAAVCGDLHVEPHRCLPAQPSDGQPTPSVLVVAHSINLLSGLANYNDWAPPSVSRARNLSSADFVVSCGYQGVLSEQDLRRFDKLSFVERFRGAAVVKSRIADTLLDALPSVWGP
jgi:hypothetical protein